MPPQYPCTPDAGGEGIWHQILMSAPLLIGGLRSKFANSAGGGFGASVMKNIGTGGPRVTYSNNRFGSLMNNTADSTRSELQVAHCTLSVH